MIYMCVCIYIYICNTVSQTRTYVTIWNIMRLKKKKFQQKRLFLCDYTCINVLHTHAVAVAHVTDSLFFLNCRPVTIVRRTLRGEHEFHAFLLQIDISNSYRTQHIHSFWGDEYVHEFISHINYIFHRFSWHTFA